MKNNNTEDSFLFFVQNDAEENREVPESLPVSFLFILTFKLGLKWLLTSCAIIPRTELVGAPPPPQDSKSLTLSKNK